MAVDWVIVLYGLVIAVLGLGVGLAIAGLRRLRAASELLESVDKALKQGAREQGEIKPLALQLGERLTALENRVRQLNERVSQVESRSHSGPDYDQAIRMAKKGANPDELMRQCGLGQSEAKLVVAVHGVGR